MVNRVNLCVVSILHAYILFNNIRGDDADNSISNKNMLVNDVSAYIIIMRMNHKFAYYDKICFKLQFN